MLKTENGERRKEREKGSKKGMNSREGSENRQDEMYYGVKVPKSRPVCLSVYLSIYGSIALVDPCRFFSFLTYVQSVGLLGRGISQSQGRYLQTE
jgi:hypothetical protein